MYSYLYTEQWHYALYGFFTQGNIHYTSVLGALSLISDLQLLAQCS